jgi:putative protease
MAWLHERGVKGYVTMNTLIFSSDLPEAARVLAGCSAAGVDAVLVQDLGLAALMSRLVPDLPVHASTQMTLTSAESISGAESLGLQLQRVVAARETSIKELKTMRRGTSKEIEVFVHGAICVAYSGQCLTSEALGGRSANRGECAQACRLPYDLVVDGQAKDVGDVKYVLSPKDLAAYEDLDELVRTGIVSLKIEGRLKSPEYVAATVQSYRHALDQVFEDAVDSAGEEPSLRKPRLDGTDREKLEMTFSRGFTGGYLHSIDHQRVVEGRFPKKRGLFLGRVTRLNPRGIVVALEGPLKPGDGIVFDAGRPGQDEAGGRVYELWAADEGRSRSRRGHDKPQQTRLPQASGTALSPARVELTFGEHLDLRRVHVGDRVWKTSDPALERELAASFEGDQVRFRRAVHMVVKVSPDHPLQLRIADENGLSAEVQDTDLPEVARTSPLTTEHLQAQLGRLGNTPFVLAHLDAEISGDLLVPASRLNLLRRRAVEALIQKRRESGRARRVSVNALKEMRAEMPTATTASPASTSRLTVLCRSLEQVEAAASRPDVAAIYTDFEDIRLHREARQLVPGHITFAPGTLRVQKPGEAPLARKLLEAEPDAVLVRNLAAMQVLSEHAPGLPLLGDYSLNVANDLTAHLLIQRGMRQLTPSYDLNIDQLLDLLGHAPAEWFEVTIHQHLPMFHMEHCVFCRFLSKGTDFTNCGRPCESHTLELKDRMGYNHPVKADAGCRNTVYNAIAQSGSEYLGKLLQAGVRRYRVEFIAEPATQVTEVLNAYAPAIRGEVDGHNLWRQLSASSKLGVTRGSLDFT